MPRRSQLPLTGLLLSLLALLLVVPLLGAPAQADPSDPSDPVAPAVPDVTVTPSAPSAPSTTDTPRDVAEAALEKVEDLVDAGTPPVTDDAGIHGEDTDLTVALRDLAINRQHLPKRQRDAAARMLARPDGEGSTCDQGLACYARPKARPRCEGSICVQYVKSGRDRATSAYVDLVLGTVKRIARRYQKAGYRAPVGDGLAGGGGTNKFDVYLADIGDLGYYGYCNPSDTDAEGHTRVAAYCVLDNDYRPGQYGSQLSQRDNLRVTAAHEYFHAVQFAYDFAEDGWFMEATATWIEDEKFDGINDNRWYLQYGPMGSPHRPLDTVSSGPEYGAWIFFRFLSERFPGARGNIPVIVRQMWEKASHEGPGARSMYSVQAIESALRDRKKAFRGQFARFAAWNRRPSVYYSEGRAYQAAPLRWSYALSPSRRKKRLEFKVHHLAAKHVRYTPRSLNGSWKLRVRLNLNSKARGGFAFATIKPKGRRAYVRKVRLNAKGNARVTYPFAGRIQWVELAVVNASTRYDCGYEGLPPREYTCSGFPEDDRARQKVVVRAVRG